jgi:hypothetical protein
VGARLIVTLCTLGLMVGTTGGVIAAKGNGNGNGNAAEAQYRPCKEKKGKGHGGPEDPKHGGKHACP